MPVTIRAAVGRHLQTGVSGSNNPDDVNKVQTLLRVATRLVGVPRSLLQVDGLFGPQTSSAIAEFQQTRLGFADGVVDPNQRTLAELNVIAATPVQEILRSGDMSKTNPYTILFIANPALETPWNSGTFALDPVMTDQAAFDSCVKRSADCLFGAFPGQGEVFLADPMIAPRIRVISIFQVGLDALDANSLVTQDGVSNLLIARRQVYVAFLARLSQQADVVYSISKSDSHTRASAWYTSDNDAGPGINFTLDGVTLSHRFHALIPGTIALHTSSSSVTPLHEFGHAASSYTNGSVLDLYIDSPPALNNKRGRPIPGGFATYVSTALASDTARDSIGYPAGWQSYHCEHHDPSLPSLMDDYWLASSGAGGPDACQHDKITRQFLRDRILAKLSR